MALIPLYEAKTYLRVDSSDEDALIGILLSSAEQMCKDVGRLSEDQWEAVNAADRDAENGVQPTRELEALRSTCRVAILYALGYLYEHRDEADHKQLMAVTKKIEIDGKEVTFKASAAVPRLYRIKFGRDIYKDLRQLEKSVGENDEDNSNLDLFSLEMFEDLAWLMARHADPAKVPDSPEEFLDQFNTFSIYQILPQLIELWGLNVQTEVESRKNLAKVSGK